MLRKDEVSLYPIEEKHLPFLVKWGNAGGLSSQSRSKRRTNVIEQAELIQNIAESNDSQMLAVHLHGVDQPVGVCEIFKIDWLNRSCFLNVYLEDKEKVLGVYGFKIIRLISEYLFKRLGLYKVSVDVLLENSLYTSLYKQLEFKVEVTKRRHAFVGGKYKTVLEMSLLKHEFEKQYG